MKLLEYHAIYEFNTLRDKTFVPLNQFLDALRLVKPLVDSQQTKSPIEQMCAKLKRSQSGLISVILVAGIPGSGKGRFAASLARMLKQEKLHAEAFKMPTVSGSVRYSTNAFVDALIKAADEEQQTDVMVATIPAYHHLKKVIFELRKHELYVNKFEIKFVLTKVNANNFFCGTHRNIYQFLIENCMKGVSQAILVERGAADQNDFEFVMKHLHNASHEMSVLVQTARIDLDALAKILLKQSDKLNMFYTKHFYGFEKEGKCDYYQEKAVQGTYFGFKYPLKKKLVEKHFVTLIDRAIADGALL